MHSSRLRPHVQQVLQLTLPLPVKVRATALAMGREMAPVMEQVMCRKKVPVTALVVMGWKVQEMAPVILPETRQTETARAINQRRQRHRRPHQ